ncbi:MAG: HSP90 family protein [Lachnospiraceae bacterium]|nr:HSP90 family protein [Lachnospiraceae bacterium]
MADHRFKVNLSGMIEILSDHLYSSPEVYIRELLQNAVDAIVARKKVSDSSFDEGSIHVFLENNTLRFIDNGIGLNEEEIHKFLSIIGESSKKQLNESNLRSDYIGKFGIGLLSCFMVSNEIKVITRSVSGEDAFIWIGKPDGTYTLETYENGHDAGTEIILSPKADSMHYFEYETVRDLLMHYGLILPYPIYLSDGANKVKLTPPVLPWEKDNIDKSELMQYGLIMFGTVFLDAIVLRSEAGEATGVAYILPYSVQASAKQKHLIYLKNMLLTEKGEDILPSWAFFTQCIINAQNLRPTASRESFYNDDILEKTREEIGKCITDYLIRLSRENQLLFRNFMEIHEIALRGIACSDDEMFDTFIDTLYFHTTKGYLTGEQVRQSGETLVYANSSEFKHLSQIFMSQNRLLINTGYIYTMELLLKFADKYDLELEKAGSDTIEEMLIDLSPADAEYSVKFLSIAEKALNLFNVDVDIKQFIPADLPAFYFIDKDAIVYQEVQDAMEQADELYFDILSNFASSIKKVKPVIYFNVNNPVIMSLLNCEDEKLISDIVTVLYVQTLLIGGFHLHNNELGTMNLKLLSLFDRCL